MTPAVTRLPDWEDRLAAALREAQDRPFGWGSHDCCLFVADVTLAMTGTDPAAGWRGKYSSEEAAFRLLASAGVTGFVNGIMANEASRLGFPEVSPGLSRRGDWCLVLPPGRMTGPMAGVDTGARIAVVASPGGFCLVPRTVIHRAWHVPFPGAH